MTYKEISKVTNVTYDMIRNIHNGKSWTHISCDYKFSCLPPGTDIDELEQKMRKIHKVCMLIESNLYTLKEISDLSGIKYGMVYKILTGESYTDISSKYKISNYSVKRHT